MKDFSKGQFLGFPNAISDFDLVTVALFLHRANLFQELIEKEAETFKIRFPMSRKEKNKGETGSRNYVKRVSEIFKKSIEEFEKEEGPLWARDTIAHTPITHGYNIGAYSNFPGYGLSPKLDRTKDYVEKLKEAETVPFEIVNKLSKEMLKIISYVKPLNEYNPISKRDKDEVEELKNILVS
jgi:hypothetical protein